MTIDNPFDALKQQFQMEDLSASPVSGMLLRIASALPLPPPFDKIVERLKEHLAVDSFERVRLMLETCVEQTCKNTKAIEDLRQSMTTEESETLVETLRDLVLDAARKAENTRDMQRVKRIGLILANGVAEPKATDADEVEEMMRVATELSDQDVKHLRELVRVDGPMLEAHGHISRYDAHSRWEQGFWGTRIEPEIDSVFSKLESYGLVSRLVPPNNLNILADFQNRYMLLPKGLRFVSLIRLGS
jgi:hypothetical protein